MKIETIGQAIDYVRKDGNRRVSGVNRFFHEPGDRYLLRWNAKLTKLESMFVHPDGDIHWEDACWSLIMRLEDFCITRDIPSAPTGFDWVPVEGLTFALSENGTPIDHIADTRERDIQAARVAEFDSRPKG